MLTLHWCRFNSTQLATRRWLARGKKLSVSLCISLIPKVAVNILFLNDSAVLQFINSTGKLFHSVTLIERPWLCLRRAVKIATWLCLRQRSSTFVR